MWNLVAINITSILFFTWKLCLGIYFKFVEDTQFLIEELDEK